MINNNSSVTSIVVKYTWRELTNEGLMPIQYTGYSFRGYGTLLFDDVYDSEEDAISDFLDHFKNNKYIHPQYVLIKVYGKCE
jgi:hypothetical protein